MVNSMRRTPSEARARRARCAISSSRGEGLGEQGLREVHWCELSGRGERIQGTCENLSICCEVKSSSHIYTTVSQNLGTIWNDVGNEWYVELQWVPNTRMLMCEKP